MSFLSAVSSGLKSFIFWVTFALFAGGASAGAQAIIRLPLINTVAGNGTNGYGGDGGPATSAEFSNPYGIAMDNAGNLYIADPANNRVRKLTIGTGVITTVAGNGSLGYSGDNGPATNAQLQAPFGETVDSAGNLYIADAGNNVIRKVDSTGVITTVAGNNTTGYSGDNGPATKASLNSPSGVAVDAAGNLFIADSRNNRIRKVAAVTGVITTIAGNGAAGYSGDNGAATNATLNGPDCVVLDSNGNIYFVDYGNNAVRKVDGSGTITTVAGNGTAGYSGDGGPATGAALNEPHGVAIDSTGNLYIADSQNNVIRMVDPGGTIISIAGSVGAGFGGDGGPAQSAVLNNPEGVVVDAQGNIYFSDRENNRVREVVIPGGSVAFPTKVVGATSAAVTIPLQVITEGTTITGVTVPVSQGNRQEYAVTAPGCALNTALAASTICNVTVTFTPAYPGARPAPLQVASSAGQFNFGLSGIGTAPQASLSPGIINTFAVLQQQYALGKFTGGVTVDSAGNIYAAMDESAGEVQRLFIFEFAAGTGAEISQSTAEFANPGSLGLAQDSASNTYAAVSNYAAVFRISATNGELSTVAGQPVGLGGLSGGGASGYSGDNGPAINAELNNPTGVAVDSADNLYIADSGNNRIRKVAAASGIITTVAGNGTAGESGDNGPAINAALNNPTAIAVDSAGNLYIGDSSNHRIRKVDAATNVITTIAGNGTAGYTGDGGAAVNAEINDLASIAVDAAGNVYFLDYFVSVVRMVNVNGIITTVAGNGTQGKNGDGGPATSAQLSSGATGIALDSAGNLYIVADNAVRVVNVSGSAVNFPGGQIGASSTQSVVVTNIGNAPLSWTVPSSGQNPSLSPGFTMDNTSTCPQLNGSSAASSLAAGDSCSLAIDFVPAGATAITGTATIADNSLSTNATQSISLTGGAGQIVATTTTINVASPYAGQTQVSATIAGVSGTLVPAGSVVFTVDGSVQPAVMLDATASAALPATVANALSVGSHTVAAVYTSTSAGFGNSNANRIFTVGPAPSVAVAPASSTLSVAAGGSVTDTITATPSNGYAGTLQFACSGLPQYTTCTFKPSTLTLSAASGAQSTVVTLQTTGSAAQASNHFLGTLPVFPAMAFWTPGLLAVLGRRKKRHGVAAFCTIALLLLAGCGGGGSSAQNPPPPSTPAGNSTVQITASNAGAVVQSFTVSLTVQ